MARKMLIGLRHVIMQAQDFVQTSARFLEKLKATGPGVAGTALPQGLVLLNAFQVRDQNMAMLQQLSLHDHDLISTLLSIIMCPINVLVLTCDK